MNPFAVYGLMGVGQGEGRGWGAANGVETEGAEGRLGRCHSWYTVAPGKKDE